EEVVFYCGSGVTACHNIVAAVHSGLPEPRLYAGSWSEWCSDPGRPVATGA
ncbi:MAG: sulfurtransferase, partial [Gammaproteobacteria bacterium]